MKGILGYLSQRAVPLRFLADRRGVGAVEFAIVFPFLLLLYAGASELTFGVTVDRKVANAAATISDLVTQANSVTKEELQLMTQLSRSLIEPFDPEKLVLTVTSVGIDEKLKATVDWSTNPARYRKGVAYTSLPAGIANQPGRHLIVTEAVYLYRPLVMASVLGTFNLTRSAYNQPRISAIVTCTNCN